jgi:hypothetical protein
MTEPLQTPSNPEIVPPGPAVLPIEPVPGDPAPGPLNPEPGDPRPPQPMA